MMRAPGSGIAAAAPLYRGYRWLTNPHMRRYGTHASDCPWCGDDLHGVYRNLAYFIHE
jgi:DNA-binding helix-hairpin-helix protein with protein kinase domain